MQMIKVTFGFRNGMTLDFLCKKFSAQKSGVNGLIGYRAEGVIGKSPSYIEVEQIMYITTEEVEVKNGADNG